MYSQTNYTADNSPLGVVDMYTFDITRTRYENGVCIIWKKIVCGQRDFAENVYAVTSL